MYGALCRILTYSSLAFGTQNAVTLELSTPAAAAPDGVALCATDPRFTFSRDTASVPSLKQGGGIFDAPGAEQVPPAAPDWASARFFAARSPLRAVEVVPAAALLGRDPWYRRTYGARLAAGLRTDAAGRPLPAGTLQGTNANCVVLTGARRAALGAGQQGVGRRSAAAAAAGVACRCQGAPAWRRRQQAGRVRDSPCGCGLQLSPTRQVAAGDAVRVDAARAQHSSGRARRRRTLASAGVLDAATDLCRQRQQGRQWRCWWPRQRRQ